MDTQNGTIIRPNRILLATDGSEDARLAGRAAADLAGRTGAELHVAHAWRHHITAFGYPTMAWPDYSYLDEREARRVLAAQVDTVEASSVAVAGPHLLQGPPIDAILDLCDELQPGLLVMGSRGLGPVGRIFLGSVSEGVVHHARCPVLVVRGGDGVWPPGRVVAGDDGSEGARLAASLAADIGTLFGAEDVLVRAYRNPPEPIGGWSAEDRHRLDEARSREEKALRRRAEELAGVAGVRPESRVVDADATLALLLAAEEGEERNTLLAVGSRGLGVVGRARLGSVSTNVLRAASGPVLIHSRPAEEIKAHDTHVAAALPRPVVPLPSGSSHKRGVESRRFASGGTSTCQPAMARDSHDREPQVRRVTLLTVLERALHRKRRRPHMVRIGGEIVIDRPVEEFPCGTSPTGTT